VLALPQDHARWKYLVSADGVTASSRLDKLLLMNSVTFKEDSPFTQYFTRCALQVAQVQAVMSAAHCRGDGDVGQQCLSLPPPTPHSMTTHVACTATMLQLAAHMLSHALTGVCCNP
jgi:hypothetical protein